MKWRLYTNSPLRYGNVRLAGQDKVFDDEAAAERYLQGRIKAYAYLFTEISPPIPKEQIAHFRISNHLLPGYHEAPEKVEEQTKEDPAASKQKPSVLGRLSKTKAQDKQQSQGSVSKPTAHEIE